MVRGSTIAIRVYIYPILSESYITKDMTRELTNRKSVLWWRLPEKEQEPYRRAYLEGQFVKRSIDRCVLEYFIQEGFHSAAEILAIEANIPLDSDENGSRSVIEQLNVRLGLDTIIKRKEIKYLILEGKVTKAIKVVGKYFPTILDSQPLLLFSLLRLNLIEMIREHKFLDQAEDPEKEKAFLNDVLNFVRENMISKVTHSSALLKDLEMTMSLLCFNFDSSKSKDQLIELPPKLRELFDLSLRRECYRQVNRAILDLNDNSASIYYHGISPEFTVSDLQSLNENSMNGMEESMHEGGNESKPLFDSNLKFPSFELSENILTSEQGESEPEDEKIVQSQDLRSQLERIAELWLATERKVNELKVPKDKPTLSPHPEFP